MRLRTCLILFALVLQANMPSLGQSLRSDSKEKRVAAAGNGIAASDWPMYGRDLAGSHYNPAEKQITPATVSRLKVKWIFEAGDDVSSQPVVVNGVVYFGSWDGKEYALDAKTGKKLWEFDCGTTSRSGAAYAEGMLFFGDFAGRLFALDAKTGEQKWKVKIDPHKNTIATSSPIK